MKVKITTEYRVACPKCKADIMFEPSEIQKETIAVHVHERPNFIKANKTKEKSFDYIECPICHEKIRLYYDYNITGHVVNMSEAWIDVKDLNNDRSSKNN